MLPPETPRAVAIVQARMGSSRLPGKVLADIEGQPMLVRVVERCMQATLVDDVVVATTLEEEDDLIAALCLKRGYPLSRGHPTDVLDRYLRAARAHSADVIVRITGDCPLMDPEVIDHTVKAFMRKGAEADYASNRLERTYPIGLDVEVMTLAALTMAANAAKKPFEREHVTPYFYEHPDKFEIVSVSSGEDHGQMRWTVDAEEDLAFVRQIYARFEPGADFGLREVLQLLEREPELSTINAHVRQRTFGEVG